MNRQPTSIETTRQKTIKLATMGMLVAISIVLLMIIRIPFPPAPFLEYDPADIPIMFGTFAFGPLAGLILTVITSLVQGITVSAASGPYGILMHIISTGTFVLVAGLIYRRKKTRKAALISLICGALAMIAIMIPANILITPLFMGTPTNAVIAMILPVILPFNALKSGINAAIVLVLYNILHNVIIKYLNTN